MKVFAPGAFHWRNKGDAALVLAFLDWLEDSVGAEEVVLTSFAPKEDSAFYGREVLPMATQPTRIKGFAYRLAAKVPGLRPLAIGFTYAYTEAARTWLRIWAGIYRRNPRRARWLAPRHIVKIADEVVACDAIVTVPGGYLIAQRATDDQWLMHLATFELAKALGAQVILGPCSVGPFSRIHRPAASRALKSIDFMYLRETKSASIAESLGVQSDQIRVCPDMAFRFAGGALSDRGVAALETARKAAGSRPMLAISVREHHFPGHANPKQMEQRYLELVAETVRALVNGEGAHAVIVPQTEWDVAIGARLSNELAGIAELTVIDDVTLEPKDLQAFYGQCQMVLGTRMHANILALTAGTPVVGIAYEPKTLGILEQLELSEWGLPIDALEGVLLPLAIERWRAAPGDRELVRARVGKMRAGLAEAGEDLRLRVQA